MIKPKEKTEIAAIRVCEMGKNVCKKTYRVRIGKKYAKSQFVYKMYGQYINPTILAKKYLDFDRMKVLLLLSKLPYF